MTRPLMLPTLCLALGLTAQGCFLKSPLDARASVKVDPSVFGTWRCLGVDEPADAKPANFEVGRLDEFRYRITFRDEDEEPQLYEVHASVVKGRTVLNARLVDANPEDPKQWALASYSFLRADVVQVQLADHDKLRGADASPRMLRAAFEKALHQGLLTEWCVCVRAKG